MCDKVYYNTRKMAKGILKLLNKHHHHKARRVYYCNECFGYHITSQTKEVTMALKRGYKFNVSGFVETVKNSKPNTMKYWAEKFNIHRTYVAKIGKLHGLIFKHENIGMKGYSNRFEIIQFVKDHPNQWTMQQLSKKYNVSQSTICRWKSEFNLPLARKKHVRHKVVAKSDVIEKTRDERRSRYKRITPNGINYIGDWDSVTIQLDHV